MTIVPDSNSQDNTPLRAAPLMDAEQQRAALDLLLDWYMHDACDPDGPESPFDETSKFLDGYQFTRKWCRR